MIPRLLLPLLVHYVSLHSPLLVRQLVTTATAATPTLAAVRRDASRCRCGALTEFVSKMSDASVAAVVAVAVLHKVNFARHFGRSLLGGVVHHSTMRDARCARRAKADSVREGYE